MINTKPKKRRKKNIDTKRNVLFIIVIVILLMPPKMKSFRWNWHSKTMWRNSNKLKSMSSWLTIKERIKIKYFQTTQITCKMYCYIISSNQITSTLLKTIIFIVALRAVSVSFRGQDYHRAHNVHCKIYSFHCFIFLFLFSSSTTIQIYFTIFTPFFQWSRRRSCISKYFTTKIFSCRSRVSDRPAVQTDRMLFTQEPITSWSYINV